MKAILIILIPSLTLLSCKEKQQDNNVLNPDCLSKWFIANEDSLYGEFIKYVKENSYCKTCDTTWGEMAYQRVGDDSYMGRFSLEAKKYCDSLDVTYFYNKSTNPKCRILLSTGYNRRLTTALDTLLTYPFHPKHFKLEKYEQPDKEGDVFIVDNTNAVVKDLRIQISPAGTLSDLTVFINAKPNSPTQNNDEREFFIHSLFGEEMLLKKINRVTLKFSDTINPDLPTLEETFLKLR